MYTKSNKQYYVLSHEGSKLQLVISPEFCEKENGFLDPLGYIFGQSPAPELPKPDNMQGEELSRTSGVLVMGAPTVRAPMATSGSRHDV